MQAASCISDGKRSGRSMGIPTAHWVGGRQSHIVTSLLLSLFYFMSVALALLDGARGLRQKIFGKAAPG